MNSETLLPGRTIDEVPYTGLIERLSQIKVISHVSMEAADSVEKGDLLNFIAQIGELASEATLFAGATEIEASAAYQMVLHGASTGPSGNDA